MSVLEKLKALDEQRALLLEGAKAEVLANVHKAIAQLGELGFHYNLEPIHKEWIHEQGLGLVKRLSMRRIMARRTKAATVVA